MKFANDGELAAFRYGVKLGALEERERRRVVSKHRKDYVISTWADGYGVWYAKADFTSPMGNTGAAETIKWNALQACKRAIRRELKERQSQPLKRLAYEVHDNDIDSLNRMWSITVKER